MLLRVSKFCRSSTPQKVSVDVGVVLSQTDAPESHKNNPNNSIGYVSVDVLLALSATEDSLAFLSHGTEKVILRLRLEEEAKEVDEKQPLTIRVAPIVATNLGLPTDISGAPLSNECFLEATYDPPSVADHVVLRPLGRPPVWPRFTQESTDDEDQTWLYPPSNTLLQKSHVHAVYDSAAGHIFYYQVLTVSCSDSDEPSEFFQTNSSTIYELDNSPLPPRVRRLPPLLAQHQFYNSSSDVDVPPHPNLTELLEAFDSFPATLPPNERILHVVGNDSEHHVRTAVESAAQQAGRTCWSLRGLAAFAHGVGRTTRTGSLVDQLAGLQAALQEIRTRRMEPCMLHLYDFDQELCTSDDPMRHEQEERFWFTLLQALTPSTPNKNGPALAQNRSDARFETCPLVIVLSTSAALKPGPLLENLVFPTIALKTPDAEYTKYLWNEEDVGDDTMQLLHGRTAREITWLRQQVLSGNVEDDSEQKLHDKLEKLCADLDDKRRKKSSASVANVRWEDVGGLAHVRREIMDAIELPLKHPNLFPKAGGRSGILLYGPPGTGKTLVAKAVASECGLPFLSVKGPELLGSYVGESEANIRAIFHSAREAAAQNAPISASILFFDELDSLAPRRGGVGDGGGVMERVVATLFAELDGDVSASSSGRVFVMGATNRPDLLDPSLLRPGRLDRLVFLGIPTDQSERARVLCAQMHKLRLEGDAMEMARQVVEALPPRLTGADMSTIASGALLSAVQRLCRLADEEHKQAELEGTDVGMTKMLEGWDTEKRTPVVILDDLFEASKQVVPSVSQSELDHYNRLRDQYGSPQSGQGNVDPNAVASAS